MIPPRLYLTGTDTDVGKTVASAAWCAAHGYAYVKPVQSGTPRDTERVRALAPGVRTFPESFVLSRPESPHTAAEADGVEIDVEAVRLPAADKLLVEGAGGWCVPYRAEPVVWQADLVRHLGLGVVVVTRSGLGTLNHTFLTLEAIRRDGVPVVGLIVVGPPHPRNVRDLVRYGGVPLIGRLPWVADVDAQFGELVAALR